MDTKKNLDSKRLLSVLIDRRRYICSTIAGILCILLVIVTIVIDPVVMVTKYCTKLENGSFLHNKLQEKMESVKVMMHIFNITNSERFMSGQDRNLKLEEVGPFTYREVRLNDNVEINLEEKWLRYTPNTTLYFVPEESVADPATLRVVVPNIIFLSLASKFSTASFLVRSPFVSLTTMILKSQPILNLSVNDYLWGYHDPIIVLGRRFLPGVVFYDRLGLISYVYNRTRMRYEVDISDENKFQIRTVSGHKGFQQLNYEIKSTECNTFTDAYEGILYPSNLSPEKKIRFYQFAFCRMFHLKFLQEKASEEGFKAMQYQISKEAYDNSTETECYCSSRDCYRGFSEMSPCAADLPVFLSNAHFLDTDERASHRLEGLHPDETKHRSEFLIHKKIGLPLKTAFSLQINLKMSDLGYISAAKPFSNMMLPIVWGKILQNPLPEDIVTILKFVELYLPKIIYISQIVLAIIGSCLLLYTCRILYGTYSEGGMHKERRTVILEKTASSTTETPLISSEKTKRRRFS